MDNQSQKLPTHHKQHSLLSVVGKITIQIIAAGLVLAFGFWLIIASNMGSAYLPQLMDGALDSWIRAALLGLGAILCIATVAWLVWSILLHIYRYMIRHY